MSEPLPDHRLQAEMLALGARARAAASVLALAPAAAKAAALRQAASALREERAALLEANARDMAAATAAGVGAAFLDRLRLDEGRVAALAAGLDELAQFPDPVGTVLASWTRPNGLAIERVRVPLGVIGIVYESRPNVTADAGGLCLKAGNAAILRGGSDSLHSSAAIATALRAGLAAAGLPPDAVQLVPTRDRAAVGLMLQGLGGAIDVIVPRGGRGLVERVQAEARVPVFAHLEGVNHVYVDAEADLAKAIAVVVNSKLRRVGVCGAAETLLVDRAAAATHLVPILEALAGGGCAIRGDAAVCAAFAGARPASEADWTTEYLDAVITAGVVDGLAAAIDHVNRHGSHHTDAIVTEDAGRAERFCREVDSAIVLVNASTQFADGGEFGMGAEIGISTGRLHARGPVGADQLTTFRYVVRGNGQIRP